MELSVESATFASSTLRYIDPTTLTLEQAKIVVLKVLRDAIDTTVEGIDGQIQLGTIQKSGVRVLNKTDVRGLHDTVNLWESQCAELLPGAVTRPPTGDTLDRGVGLPSWATSGSG